MQKELVLLDKKMTVHNSLNLTTDQVLMQLLITSIYILGANMVFNLELSVGSVFTFIAYSASVISPISGLFNISFIFSSMLPATKKFYEFLNMQIETETDYQRTSLSSEMKVSPSIIYQNVFFSYENKNEVLKEINFNINPKENVALLGLNGAGRTTLINLLLRFYKPD